MPTPATSSWTPTEAQGGTTPSVTVTVTDTGTGNLVDSETFTITVNDINTAPVWVPSAIRQSMNWQLSRLPPRLPMRSAGRHPDIQPGCASIALGMSIDANTGVFTWTPTEAQGGTTPSVTITVTDTGTGNLVDSETFTITVNDTNTAPVLGAIGNQTVDELATLTFTATATDADLPADTLTFSLDAASLAAGMSIDANTGVFSWTPTEAQGGTAPSVTITVTDNGTGNLVDSETFTITVNDTNTAPVLGAIGNQTVNELATLTFTATATDSDLPADTLSFSLDAASIAAGMTIDANSGVFSWTPTEAQGGTTPSVTITVTDSGTGNLVDSETFTITVNDIADPDDGGSTTTDPELFEDPGTDDEQDIAVEAPTHEDPVDEPVIEDEQAPPVVESLTPKDSVNADEQLVNMEDQEAEEAEEIIYLTDEIETDMQSEGREDDTSLIYFDNDLYKDLSLAKYLAINYTAADEPLPSSGDDISILDLDSNDLNRADVNSDYHLHRQQIDESFDTELRSQAVKAKIVTISAATFAAGVVSYLLRVGSMVSSLMSSLPLWRGFDPIAIFSGNRKRKKDPNDMQNTSEPKSETLFDGEAE